MYLQSVFTNFKSVSFTTTIIASKYSKNDFLLNTFILVYFSETVQLIKYHIIDFNFISYNYTNRACAAHDDICFFGEMYWTRLCYIRMVLSQTRTLEDVNIYRYIVPMIVWWQTLQNQHKRLTLLFLSEWSIELIIHFKHFLTTILQSFKKESKFWETDMECFVFRSLE